MYIIIKTSEKDLVDLNNYVDDSWEGMNYSDNKEWVILEYANTLPADTQALSQYRGPFTQEEIQTVISSVEWRAVPDWMKNSQ
jgi:hypothetical protein